MFRENFKNYLIEIIVVLPVILCFLNSYVKIFNISLFHYSIFLSTTLLFFFHRLNLPKNFYFYIIIFSYLFISFYFLNYYFYYTYINNLILYFSFFNILNFYYSKKIFLIALTTIVLSSLIAFLQSLEINFFWEIRYFFSEIFKNEISYQLIDKQKASGLAYNNIQLQFHILAGLFFTELLFKNKYLKYFLIFLFFIISILTNSISILLIILLWILVRNFNYKSFIIFTLLLFFSIIFIFYFHDRNIVFSLLIRIYILFIHILLIIENTLGVPLSDLNDYKSQIFESLTNTIFFYQNYLEYIPEFSHNNFINIAIYGGIFGFILYLIFYIEIIYSLFNRYKNHQSEQLLISFIYFLFYLLLMISHNAGPFFGDPTFWLILAYSTIIKNEKNI